MSEAVILGIITNLSLLLVALIAKIDRKEIAKKVEAVKASLAEVSGNVNGMKDELVDKAGKLGEEVGKAKGRKEVEEEKKSENKPVEVFFLDDNPTDLELFERQIERLNDIVYHFFEDNSQFKKAIPPGKNIYVIDLFLIGESGLKINEEIKKKNIHNFTIAISGTMNKSLIIECMNSGVDRFVDKSSGDRIKELNKYIRDGVNVLISNC